MGAICKIIFADFFTTNHFSAQFSGFCEYQFNRFARVLTAFNQIDEYEMFDTGKSTFWAVRFYGRKYVR